MNRLQVAFIGGLVALGCGGGSSLAAQERSDLRIDYNAMQHEREKHSATEGRLIHILIRHSLGLPIEAKDYLKLTESEAGMSVSAARQTLREAQRDLALRAAELERKELSANAAPASEVKPGTQRKPDLGPQQAPVARDLPIRLPIFTQKKQTTGTNEPKPQRVVAVISGSRDKSAVGRILFKAGKYETALKELAPLENDKNADYADLFYLARCYEELHDLAKAVAAKAEARAANAKWTAALAKSRADEIRTAGQHMRSTGGTLASEIRYKELRDTIKVASQQAAAGTQEFNEKMREAAGHYERAYSIFILIEGRDVRKTEDAKEVPGKWAEAARSARNMMKWIETNDAWTPPKLEGSRG